jgi:hypothetical protein
MRTMEISKPIFILGNIRSGTTILYNLMSVHPDVCWFSNYTNRRPGAGPVALAHRLLDVPGLGTRFKKAIARNVRPGVSIPWPDEGDDIYHAYSGFGKSKDGLETVFTGRMESKLRTAIRNHLKYTGKARFLSKETANNRRIELLNTMFPDACYIHMIRDGRAVASSTLRVPWWNDTHIWWLGFTASAWEKNGKEPIELAALYWQRTVEEIWDKRGLFVDRYIEARYEDLVADTKGVIGALISFCGLAPRPEYFDLLPETLPGGNYKWKEQLSEKEKKVLYECVGPFLDTLGYTDR